MSYCRWSSDSFRCDLYCYEHVDGGWITHVASNRIPADAPKEDWSLLDTEDGREEFLKQHNALMDYLDTVKRTPIGLPFDGRTFNDPTLSDFKERLVMLRDVGYMFPDDVIKAVDEEMAQEKS